MLQDRTIPTSSMTITNGCISDNTVASLLQYYVQSAWQVPNTKVQHSMTANTNTDDLTTYRGLYAGP